MIDYLQVGKRLKQLRNGIKDSRGKSISQKEFAKRLDVPHKTYQRYELGQNAPDLKVVAEAAEICGTTVDWILTGDIRSLELKVLQRKTDLTLLEKDIAGLDDKVIKVLRERGIPVPSNLTAFVETALFFKEHNRLQGFLDLLTLDHSITELIKEVVEVVETGPADVITALKANVKAFLNATRKAKDRRIYPRVLLTVPVEFQIMDQPESRPGAILNGSQMGFLIQATHDMPVGSKIHLKVTLPGRPAEDSFRASAEILWKDKRRLDNAEAFQYGVKFLEVLNEGHSKLESLLLKEAE